MLDGSSGRTAAALPDRLSRLLAWAAGLIILVGCGGLITVDVVTRAIFRRGMVESFELSGYALAAGVGLGLASTVVAKANIRVDILLDIAPRALRRLADLLAAIALAVAAAALAWHAWGTLAQSWRMDARSVSTLQTPMVIPQAIWWVGIAWFAVMAALAPIRAVRRLLAGDPAGFEARIGGQRIEDEIALAARPAARPPER